MFRKKVGMYEMCPRWYRLTYRDNVTGINWAYPLGIHWLVHLARRIWILTYVWPRLDWLEKHDAKVIAAVVEQYRPLQEENFRLTDALATIASRCEGQFAGAVAWIALHPEED